MRHRSFPRSAYPRFPELYPSQFPLEKLTAEQRSLFPASLDDMTEETGVTAAELRSWGEQGFLSFGPWPGARYENAHFAEVLFLKALFRVLLYSLRRSLLFLLENRYLQRPL